MGGNDIKTVRPSAAEVFAALVRGGISSLPGMALVAEGVGLLVMTADRMDRAPGCRSSRGGVRWSVDAG